MCKEVDVGMMADEQPAFHRIIRAPGLIATFFPLVIGTVVAVMVTGEFRPFGAFLAAVMGISLHLSMNVYNDIYDTRQGSDTLESSVCFFSGGSGVLLTNPELERSMFFIARSGMAVGFLATIGLIQISERSLWPYLIAIYLIAAFFCKYYTAQPVALSYRGLGELAVFVAFGPVAITLAALSQGIIPGPLLFMLMPITGIVTLVVTLNGQVVDLPYDRVADKNGLVIRLELRKSLHLSVLLVILLIANILAVSYILSNGWVLALFMIPFLIPLPMAFSKLYKGVGDAGMIMDGARLLFISMVICAISMMAGFIFLMAL